jgi:hypothetical protein
MHMRVRLCVVLPICFVFLSVVLARIGEAQRSRIVEAILSKHGRLEEDVPDRAALARIADQALNAPAWAASVQMPAILHINRGVTYWGIMRSERDWWYFLFVAVLWFIIGAAFDRSRLSQKVTGSTSRWWKFAGTAFLICYGLFICYTALIFHGPPYYSPVWFTAVALAWGVGLMAYPALHQKLTSKAKQAYAPDA